MGKYNAIFKCGHEEEVELFGKYKGREKRIEWYEKECDCSKCRTETCRKKMAETHTVVIMSYCDYKKKYADCKTLRDSYDRATRTILVFVPKKCSAINGRAF